MTLVKRSWSGAADSCTRLKQTTFLVQDPTVYSPYPNSINTIEATIHVLDIPQLSLCSVILYLHTEHLDSLLLLLLLTAAEMKYMRRTAGYIWTDYKTNAQIAKGLKITPIYTNYWNTREAGYDV